MADESSPSYKIQPALEVPLRRKVRKGTQSCWECKRRKIKCVFAAQSNSACDGCRRRGTPCVGQQFPQGGPEHIGDRLGRVEELVAELARNVGSTSPSVSSTPHESCHNDEFPDQAKTTKIKILPKLPSSHIARASLPVDKDQEICKALLEVWPGEQTLDIILSVPVYLTACFHGSICASPSSVRDLPSPREMLQPPAPGSPPVLLARRLLTLSSYLQAIPPDGIKIIVNLGINHGKTMSCLVETVHSLVNSNDELVASLDGIECIIMESMYYNNTGNLRRSWLTMRRAMLIAQMMGLHLDSNQSPAKNVDNPMRSRPEQICIQIVTSDRYLSLMLGLPQGAPESGPLEIRAALEDCTPEERLQCIHCVVSGRIIQRREADIHNLEMTQEMDKLLQKAALSMTPQWWLIPDLTRDSGRQVEEEFRKTDRLMSQLTHYHLVARLHLPYVLRSLAGGDYEYSKITAVNASREVLARFVAFRSSNPLGSYCRGIDFLAFIASTTICLAHIDARRQNESRQRGNFFFASLAHQRPSDRGMMERALESLEHMVGSSADIIASKISTIFRSLLDIEADAANGRSYNTTADTGGDGLECNGQLCDEGSVLLIRIPYLGAIKIQRTGISRPMALYEDLPMALDRLGGVGDDLDSSLGRSFNMPLYPSTYSIEPLVAGPGVQDEDWALQGVDTAFFDNLIRGSDLDDSGVAYCASQLHP